MTLQTPHKVLIAVVVSLLVVAGFYFLDWNAKQVQIAEIESAITKLNGEKANMEEQFKRMDKLVADNDRYKAELKELVESGITGEDEKDFVPNYLEKIEALVVRVRTEDNDSSFDITSITPGAQVSSGGKDGKDAKSTTVAQTPDALKNYPTRTFSMAMKGRYETLVDFLDRLGRLELQRLVTVNKISLSPSGNVKGGSPTLSITIPLTAYLRTGGN